MTKIEKKLLDFLASHRMLLGYVVVTALNLFLRKIAVWWSVEGVEYYYDGHAHMVQGQLWWSLMRFGMNFPILPVHFMKWVSAFGDFAMAAAGAMALSKGIGASGKKGSGSPEKGLVFYSVILIMPFTLLRGIVWSMTDSLGIACFIWAHAFAGDRKWAKVLAYAAGVLFCPALILALCFEAAYKASKEGPVLCTAALGAVIAGSLGAVNGFGFWQGVLGQVNFLTFDPLTGASFEDGTSWMLSQMWIYCLPVSVLGIYKVTAGSK